MCAIHTHSPERRKNTREKKTFSITTEKREREKNKLCTAVNKHNPNCLSRVLLFVFHRSRTNSQICLLLVLSILRSVLHFLQNFLYNISITHKQRNISKTLTFLITNRFLSSKQEAIHQHDSFVFLLLSNRQRKREKYICNKNLLG